MVRSQLILDVHDELIVDNFAGGGGASTGIELALGRHVDVAINHDPAALAMHERNHPQTLHLAEDVFAVDPVAVTGGRPVGLAWFSPDCKHFSKAKGGKPRSKKVRGLAWVILHWVNKVQPRVIILENVEEFQTWCPLDLAGKPKVDCKGWYFRCFVGALRRRGYEVEWRELRACDYGAPTIRKRLFLIARRDGRPIVWPEATHGPGKKPYSAAAGCIDWSIPCPSIFERAKPLADATCRRIAKGIMRYVVNAAEPFIISYYSQDTFRGQEVSEPLKTQTTENRFAIVSPVVVNCANSKTTGRAANCWNVNEPLRTITGASGFALVAPVLTECANASQKRVFDPQEPLRTQCAEVKGGHFALCSAFLAKHYTGVVGSDASQPMGTVTAVDHHSLVTAHLMRQFGESTGSAASEPIGTVMPGGQGKTALVTSHIAKLRGGNVGHPVTEPLHTISAQGLHHAEVRAFLIKYYGNEREGVNIHEPMHTVTARDRFGLVTVRGEEYIIVDIGLRMLQPRELYRAQGFPDTDRIGDPDDPIYYVDRTGKRRKITKTDQVRMCGNSVCPPQACALVAANVPEMAIWESSEKQRKVL